jgi:3D (Asp-Asp-Asp) domain-containing protein
VNADDDGWEATVVGVGSRGLGILPGPGTAVAALTTLTDGTHVRVIGSPRVDRDGRSWYLVTGFGQAGAVGWSRAEFLIRVEPERPAAVRTTAAAAPSGRTLNATLTAYAHGTTTRSGTPVRWGVVAVDPEVIPLGSRLMIEGYDTVFVAEDTGGGVRGTHVDVYFPDIGSALRFGVQNRTVTVLP